MKIILDMYLITMILHVKKGFSPTRGHGITLRLDVNCFYFFSVCNLLDLCLILRAGETTVLSSKKGTN